MYKIVVPYHPHLQPFASFSNTPTYVTGTLLMIELRSSKEGVCVCVCFTDLYAFKKSNFYNNHILLLLLLPCYFANVLENSP